MTDPVAATDRAEAYIKATRETIELAVAALRDVDRVTPIFRRKLVAAADDLGVEVTRVQGALQRLVERSVERNITDGGPGPNAQQLSPEQFAAMQEQIRGGQ